MGSLEDTEVEPYFVPLNYSFVCNNTLSGYTYLLHLLHNFYLCDSLISSVNFVLLIITEVISYRTDNQTKRTSIKTSSPNDKREYTSGRKGHTISICSKRKRKRFSVSTGSIRSGWHLFLKFSLVIFFHKIFFRKLLKLGSFVCILECFISKLFPLINYISFGWECLVTDSGTISHSYKSHFTNSSSNLPSY